ncbi:MAG: glycosyltransferase family 2 protein [Pseudomonadota bacterium]
MSRHSIYHHTFEWRPGFLQNRSGDDFALVRLPDGVRRLLAKQNVHVFLQLSIIGADRNIRPRIEFDFGDDFRQGSGTFLNQPLPTTLQELTLPRGTKRIKLKLHTEEFTARQLLFSMEHVSATRPGENTQYSKNVRRVFSAQTQTSLNNDSGLDAMIDEQSHLALATVGTFSATNDDPWVSFFLREPLSKGWWRAELTGALPEDHRARLYLETEKGLVDLQAAEFVDVGYGRYAAMFHLAEEVDAVRLDPLDRPGYGIIDTLTLKKVGKFPLSPLLLKPETVKGLATGDAFRIMVARSRGRGTHEGAWPLPVKPKKRQDLIVDPTVRYKRWREKYDFKLSSDKSDYQQKLASLDHTPLISIVTPVFNTPLNLLDAMVQSVIDQLYDNWELCIADDASPDESVRKRLKEWVAQDKRIKVVERRQNGNISLATQSAFDIATGDWIALLDHDDVLRPHALLEVAMTINERPDAQIIYSDEDKIDEKGERFDPYFKPDFSPLMFLGQNYLNHLTVHRADNIRCAGGWRVGFEGSQDYDLSLRILKDVGRENVVHIPKILYHWRAVAGSTASSLDEKSYAFDAGLRAIQEYVDETYPNAEAKEANTKGYYRVEFPVPDPAPLVSLIIPTRDYGDLVETCVTSIQEKSSYRNFEIIIVDNGSTEQDTLDLFESYERTGDARVLRYDDEFNYSAINNYAVERSNGEIIGLINNDIEVISEDWLTEMVSLAVQPDIGSVGAKLYYPDDTLQHGGVIVGVGGVAGHSHKYFAREDPGYFSRLMLAQDLTAVTAACLLTRRGVFEEVGGLDEENLAVAFNDIDFCLKVRKAGYRVVWTPNAELYHYESKSRGKEVTAKKQIRFQREIEHMVRKWDTRDFEDPFYSPHLSKEVEDFRIK